MTTHAGALGPSGAAASRNGSRSRASIAAGARAGDGRRRPAPRDAVRALFALALLVPAPGASAQDRAAAVPDMRVLFENDCVRVQFHDVEVGARTPMHSHPNYVVYAFDDYEARITLADGSQRMSRHAAGESFWNDATRHAVENVGRSRIHNLVVELKPGDDCASAPRGARAR